MNTMTVAEAYKILGAKITGRYNITMKCWNHREKSDTSSVEWRVWDCDRDQGFDATTLEQVVAMALTEEDNAAAAVDSALAAMP